ncbi:Short-chain dehydrogenase [Neofusicoccum parvum]|uniref:Short-chain dehydrogenase n=1 Tax=Neofusicoccum parvum TaxID=310453 RepID=A0ACB5SDP1_9PEZI|nr:Short-chain dehydrogenase [Neofusicoccum parvum]
MPSMPSIDTQDFLLSEVFDVKNKVALVTGGGSGIGMMATVILAANGAKVYIVGRTKDKLDKVVEVYGHGLTGEIIPLVCDVTNKDGVEGLVKEIESREKCLCILINNAGISAEKTTPDGENAEDSKKKFLGPNIAKEWTDIYATNVVSPYLMATAFLHLLQKSPEYHPGFSSNIININLVKISQGNFSCNASMGALVQLNMMLESVVAKAGLNIRINSIAPRLIASGMTTRMPEGAKGGLPEGAKGGLPAQRPGNARNVASAILFVATNQWADGSNYSPVCRIFDGGYVAREGQ